MSKFNKDDVVQIIQDDASHGFEIGTIGRVCELTGTEKLPKPHYPVIQNNVTRDVYETDMIAVASPVVTVKHKPKWKVGDKAIVSGGQSGHGFRNGDVVRLDRIDGYASDAPWYCTRLTDEYKQWINPENLLPLQSSEPKKQENTDMSNKFMIGTIVTVIGDENDHGIDGEAFHVADYRSSDNTYMLASDLTDEWAYEDIPEVDLRKATDEETLVFCQENLGECMFDDGPTMRIVNLGDEKYVKCNKCEARSPRRESVVQCSKEWNDMMTEG